MITIEDFDKVEMRAGTVLDIKKNKKSRNPAYVLTIDFGEEIGVKKSSAQITTLYRAGDFIYWFRFPFLVPTTPGSARTYTGAPHPYSTPSTPRPSPTRVPGGCSEARPHLWLLREAVRKAVLALHPHWLPLPLPSPWSPERGAVSGPFRPFGPKLSWSKREQGTTGEEERRVWGLGRGLGGRKASRAVRGPNVPAAAAGAQRGCGTEGPWQAGRGLSRI